jgi:hypothetical protein
LGGGDVILSSYDYSGNQNWTNTIGGESGESPAALTYNSVSDEVYISTIIYPSYDGDPGPGQTLNSGPIYSYHAQNGTIASWGSNFINDGSFREPFLEALSTGEVIAGQRFVSFGFSTDFAPGTVDYFINGSSSYDIYLAKYGYCQPTSNTINVTVCQYETYNYNSNILAAGAHEFYYLNSGGCDSLVTVNVVELLPVTIDTNIAVCGSSYQIYDTTFTQSGSGVLNFYNSSGCLDTIVNISVTLTGELVVNYSGGGGLHFFNCQMPVIGTYTLINCDNNQVVQQSSSGYFNINSSQSAVASAYQLIFTPTDPSNASFNGCYLQSNCIQTNTGTLTLQCPPNQTIGGSQSAVVPNLTTSVSTTTTCPTGINNISQTPSAGMPLQIGANTVTVTAVDNCGNALSCITVVNYDPNAGLDDFGKFTTFSVYPNPAESQLTIDLTSLNENAALVELIDLSGKVLLSKLVKTAELVQLDVMSLSKGVYTIRVTGEKSIGSKRFLK